MHLKALLKCFQEGNEERLYAIGLQMAADEAQLGHGQLAAEMRQIVDAIRARYRMVARRQPVGFAQMKGQLACILSVSYPEIRLVEMILPEKMEGELRRLIQEHRQQATLQDYGLHPRSKLLLTGPHGSGKTLSAKALAGELRLPLFSIMLDGLISRFAGESTAMLGLVFEAMRNAPGIYLFDHFESIGGQGCLSNDVGDVRGILNSFLALLDETQPSSLVIAATNHPELLDPALFRHFDDVLQYDLPALELICKTLRSRFSSLDSSTVLWDHLAGGPRD